MNKKKKIILILVSILCVWLLIGIVDFSLVHNYHKPLFCIGVNLVDDGGSGKYVGLGYSFDIEGNFLPESEEPEVTSYKGYLFGKKITRGYWERMLTEDDKNKLIYGNEDVLNFDNNEIIINNESGEHIELKKQKVEFMIEPNIDTIQMIQDSFKTNTTQIIVMTESDLEENEISVLLYSVDEENENFIGTSTLSEKENRKEIIFTNLTSARNYKIGVSARNLEKSIKIIISDT